MEQCLRRDGLLQNTIEVIVEEKRGGRTKRIQLLHGVKDDKSYATKPKGKRKIGMNWKNLTYYEGQTTFDITLIMLVFFI